MAIKAVLQKHNLHKNMNGIALLKSYIKDYGQCSYLGVTTRQKILKSKRILRNYL